MTRRIEDLWVVGRILWYRARLRRREGWGREQLREHQARELRKLRAHAYALSPFYRQFHRGLEDAPLEELPVLTKSTLMERFDTVVTEPTLRRSALEEHLRNLREDGALYLGYHVAATSGSSGKRAIVPTSDDEWARIVASYARANEWAGVSAGPFHPASIAVVSSTSPLHQSFQVGATIRAPFLKTWRFDAATPLQELVKGLNDAQPGVLVAYASMLRILASERLARRLTIQPRTINCSSEVCTEETRALCLAAWGMQPFEVYAATETGGIAAECSRHQGLHLFEDLAIVEPIDSTGKPVPPGQTGERLLVTALTSRTLPLIRYELTDRVRLATKLCPCGLPFRKVEAIEGRTDDVLRLPGDAGSLVELHPVAVHRALDLLDVAGWQLRQEDSALRLIVAGPGPRFREAVAVESLLRALREARVSALDIVVEQVPAIPAAASGKRPLIVAARSNSSLSSPSHPHR